MPAFRLYLFVVILAFVRCAAGLDGDPASASVEPPGPPAPKIETSGDVENAQLADVSPGENKDAKPNHTKAVQNPAKKTAPLAVEGQPGDVRLVITTTNLAQRQRWMIPKFPIPPFSNWNKWLDKHEISSHSSLDWMDDKGKWWHTEIRGIDHHPKEFRVGEGEFQGTGITVYGVFILPGRTDPEDTELIADEKLECDYHKIEAAAHEYGRKDKESGEPGTGGNGMKNSGLGGPAFRPAQNCNTYAHWLLKQAGIKHDAPPNAVGWETEPHFPFSSEADR